MCSQVAADPGAQIVSESLGVHGPPSGPEEPELQVQAVIVILPAEESEFSGQLLQVAFPLAALYVPATHSVHRPPLGPENPALHVQAVEVVLCAGALELDGQLWHVAALLALENVPGAQIVHKVASRPIINMAVCSLLNPPDAQ